MLVDSHCHLNYEGLVEDQAAVLERARQAGVRAFLNISTRRSEWDDVVATAHNARSVSDSAQRLVVDNEAKIGETVANVHASSENLNRLSQDAQVLVTNVSQGKGTVGALLSDREVYDDLKEILRIIKQRPWKIVWKE